LRDSLPIDMLFSAVYVLVVAQSSSEFPEGLMNNPVEMNSVGCFVYIVLNITHTFLIPFTSHSAYSASASIINQSQTLLMTVHSP